MSRFLILPNNSLKGRINKKLDLRWKYINNMGITLGYTPVYIYWNLYICTYKSIMLNAIIVWVCSKTLRNKKLDVMNWVHRYASMVIHWRQTGVLRSIQWYTLLILRNWFILRLIFEWQGFGSQLYVGKSSML